MLILQVVYVSIPPTALILLGVILQAKLVSLHVPSTTTLINVLVIRFAFSSVLPTITLTISLNLV